VSKEIDINKNTTIKAGNYNKHILAGSDQLDAITKLANEIRDWHGRQTLPWSDTGTRLLPMTNFFDYKQQLGVYEAEFKSRINTFIQQYPNIIQSMVYKLGNLFDRSEYPDADKIESKFNLRYTIMPVPETKDFRVDIADDIREEMQKEYQKAYEGRVETAMSDAWSRLHNTLEHMVDRLSGDDKKIFRNSLVDNALELTNLLTRLNVTKDPKLEHARQALEQSLVGVTANDLRESQGARQEILSRVNEIMESI
jgi:SNF2 family DNA or RNA helicase